MKTALLLFALLMVSATLAWSQDTKIEEVGRSPIEANFPSGGQVRMDLCSSGVDLKGTYQSKLRVLYHPEGDRTANVKVRFQSSGSHGDLIVSGCPHNNFQMTIEVPKFSDLYIRMFAGQLDIAGITGNKDLELHAGQLTVDVGKRDDYAHVDGSVNSGEVEAASFDVSKGGLFRSFAWNGSGKHRLHAHVGAGQLDLR